jgi:hypothetical protein
VRETHFASFVLDFPSTKVARDELIVLRSLVNNAEAGAQHRYENLVIQDVNGNFRSHEPSFQNARPIGGERLVQFNQRTVATLPA